MKWSREMKPGTSKGAFGSQAYYTPRQVAQRFLVKELTVRLWLNRGLLKGIKVGHSWRVSRAALEDFENAGDK